MEAWWSKSRVPAAAYWAYAPEIGAVRPSCRDSILQPSLSVPGHGTPVCSAFKNYFLSVSCPHQETGDLSVHLLVFNQLLVTTSLLHSILQLCILTCQSLVHGGGFAHPRQEVRCSLEQKAIVNKINCLDLLYGWSILES
eukprot:1141208-Pelagomonas_calceolata.AAC.1